MKKFVFVKENDILCGVMFSNGEPVGVYMNRQNVHLPLYSIVIGRVSSIKEDLNAAFVDLGESQRGYLPFSSVDFSTVLNRKCEDRLKCGDEVLVQIVKMPVKSKLYEVSSKIEIGGRYCVVTNEKKGLRFSKKLSSQFRNEFKNLFDERLEVHLDTKSIVVRTAAEKTDFETVFSEIELLCEKLDTICKKACSRVLYSCLYNAEPEYYQWLKQYVEDEYEIVTDDDNVFSYLKEEGEPVDLYTDCSLSLNALYNLKRCFSLATSKKINLKCGGFLVIEHTEAMTVIDVNSGKADAKNKFEMTVKVNHEAADEIFKQLILRNISGIIIIDFINMDSLDSRKEMTDYMKHLLTNDRVKSVVVDFTKLGLMEVTRQKIHASIYDYINNYN